MKKTSVLVLILLIAQFSFCQDSYIPDSENIENRIWFQDAGFGLFIHWGVYSILANGEWVMHNTKIPVKQYEKLPEFFNPIAFDPYEWVKIAKRAGMKYIVITAKHHDGFAMYDSEVSDYDITDCTPYNKDVLKLLSEACEKEGLKLFFYYSHLDWHHPDFYKGGKTGQYSGREKEPDFDLYIHYMNEQLKELLTQYGEIGGIWFDGIWDKKDADWQLQKTYNIIHELQPGCLIGNNHHLPTFDGEDFQMFEKDLPGNNTSGWAAEQSVSQLALETCETISGNGSWGFNIYDKETKSSEDLIQYLVKAAGYNSNFLLNTGPMPNGKIRPEHIKILNEIGMWMDENGETIYETRGGPFQPDEWGVSTHSLDKIYLHILKQDSSYLILPPLSQTIKSAAIFTTKEKIQFDQNEKEIKIKLPDKKMNIPDLIIELEY